MKRLLLFLLFGVCSLSNAAESTNLLSIHLMNLSRQQVINGELKVSNVRPLSEPILSDQDFTAYDVSKHTFTIKVEAAKRLARALSGSTKSLEADGKPFVLCVSGEPVYVGVFSCSLSSTDYSYPTIYPWEIYFDPETSTNQTFYIRREPIVKFGNVTEVKSLVPNLWPASEPDPSGKTDLRATLEWATLEQSSADVRDDRRIYNAIKKLKLNQ